MAEQDDILEFGAFRLDARKRSLLRNGQPVALPGKAFETLLALAQRPGETVTKEELMKAVWPDTCVEEGNLAQTVFVLRKALGDSDGEPLIVTVPRKGYQFTGTVRGTAGAAAPPDPPRHTQSPLRQTVLRRTAAWAGWMVGVFCVIWILVRTPVRSLNARPGMVQFTVAAPSGVSFLETKISPDGRSIAIIGVDAGGRRQLWVRPLDALVAHPIARAQGIPIWSPDSHSIAFWDDGKLKRIAAAGGVERVICEAPLVVGGSWGSTGTILFGGDSEHNTPTILAVSASGGRPVKVTSVDASRGETQHTFPVFLPDGRRFLYLVQSTRPDTRGVFARSLDGSVQPVRVLEDISNVEYAPGDGSGGTEGYLLFVRGNSLMAQLFAASSLATQDEPFPVVQDVARRGVVPGGSFSASRDGVLVVGTPTMNCRLVWFDRSGKRLATLGEPRLYLSPQLAPDEKSLVVEQMDPVSFAPDIWVMPFNGTPSRFTFAASQRPVWSPDGKWVAYEGIDSGLYEKPSTGPADQTTLLRPSGLPADGRIPCGWSHDNRFLFYAELNQTTGYDLWKLPTSGTDRAPVMLLNGASNEFCGVPSPDGRWIAYTTDESGRSEVFVRPLPATGPLNGRKWQISYSGGTWPRWRHDGKELYYLDGEAKMTAVSVSGDGEFRAGSPQPLFASGIFTPDARFDVTADGKRFIVPAEYYGDPAVPPRVIMNWAKARNSDARSMDRGGN